MDDVCGESGPGPPVGEQQDLIGRVPEQLQGVPVFPWKPAWNWRWGRNGLAC